MAMPWRQHQIQCVYPSGHSFFFYSKIPNFTVVPKQPFVFLTAKYEILQLHPNGYSFFYSEISNFTVVPKRPFVFYSEIRNLELFPNGHSFFYNETQNVEICTQREICFSERNREFWKLYPNGQFVFPTRKYEI